jgi:hypothetical protein
MIRFVVSSYLVFLLFLYAVPAHAIEGYPGKIWGDLRQEMPINGNAKDNTILQGWIEQGVYWFKWNDLMLNTYGTIRYKWDEQALNWNNTIGPGVGIALEKFFPQGMFFRVGAEFLLDQQYQTNITDKKATAYVTWYGWWDLKK